MSNVNDFWSPLKNVEALEAEYSNLVMDRGSLPEALYEVRELQRIRSNAATKVYGMLIPALQEALQALPAEIQYIDIAGYLSGEDEGYTDICIEGTHLYIAPALLTITQQMWEESNDMFDAAGNKATHLMFNFTGRVSEEPITAIHQRYLAGQYRRINGRDFPFDEESMSRGVQKLAYLIDIMHSDSKAVFDAAVIHAADGVLQGVQHNGYEAAFPSSFNILIPRSGPAVVYERDW